MHQVQTRISIRTVIKESPEVAKKMVTEARNVLESWHATYMDVRHRIEESGTDHRWEFDRRRLFEQTNYMGRVCGDLIEVNEAVSTICCASIVSCIEFTREMSLTFPIRGVPGVVSYLS